MKIGIVTDSTCDLPKYLVEEHELHPPILVHRRVHSRHFLLAPVPRAGGAGALEVRECVVKQPRLNRFLYEYVGGDWHWVDRLVWTDEQWRQYAAADNLRTFVACRQGSVAGYYELQLQDGGSVEIIDIKETLVFCRLNGACSGCPSAGQTLKMMVERTLKDLVDERIRVIEV